MTSIEAMSNTTGAGLSGSENKADISSTPTAGAANDTGTSGKERGGLKAEGRQMVTVLITRFEM